MLKSGGFPFANISDHSRFAAQPKTYQRVIPVAKHKKADSEGR